jgi:uncharacterized protein YjeT (DUF2065 family)
MAMGIGEAYQGVKKGVDITAGAARFVIGHTLDSVIGPPSAENISRRVAAEQPSMPHGQQLLAFGACEVMAADVLKGDIPEAQDRAIGLMLVMEANGVPTRTEELIAMGVDPLRAQTAGNVMEGLRPLLYPDATS